MKLYEFKSRPNVHQTHLEDLVLLGRDGLDELNDKIEGFINQFSSGKKYNWSTKIDGSPAVACWHKFTDYPDDSICLKSFVTSNRNCLSTKDDILEKYSDRPEMAQKLLYCLELAKHIPAGEAWQGDCLYSSDGLKETEIGGTKYLTFNPNKIIYAFTEDNPSYDKIKASNFGICFHTIYTGNLQNKSQSFSVDASRLDNVPSDIYIMSPALAPDEQKFNGNEVQKYYNSLLAAEKTLVSNPQYEELISNKAFMSYWNTFENASLSDKKSTKLNPNTITDDLWDYIYQKRTSEYDKKASTLSKETSRWAAKDRYDKDIEELQNILNSNKSIIVQLVNCLNAAVDCKMLMWDYYKSSPQEYKTFYRSRTRGYFPADMEGIAFSDQDGNIVKIVDRSTFSNANRNPDIMSGFEHNESLDESWQYQTLDQNIKEIADQCLQRVKGKYGNNHRGLVGLQFGITTSTGVFGEAFMPEREDGPFKVGLDPDLKLADDDTIQSTIYHELAHCLVNGEAIEKGLVYYNNDYNKKSGWYRKRTSKEYLPHGDRWKQVAREISLAFGLKKPITITGDMADQTDNYQKATLGRAKYIVKCSKCGNTLTYQRKTDFVTNPNAQRNYYDVKTGLNKTGYIWRCGQCNAVGMWKVEENK